MKKAPQDKKFHVAEIRMLRWISGVTKLGRMMKERIIIRGTTKVEEISKKVGKRVMVMEVEVPAKEGEEDRSEGGRIASGTTCRREDCQAGSVRPG